jgi:tetratricopeptide (TPR) repeat protein
MKLRSILSLALLLLTTVAFSQTSNLRKAKTSYTKFSDVKSVGTPQLGMNDLNTAHQALIKAVEHDKTKDLAETWVYYGLVNGDLALLNQGDKAKEYFDIAVDAIAKAKAMDAQNEHSENITALSYILAQYELNFGIKAWEEQDFKAAYDGFDKAEKFIPGDTTLLYYAGAAAVQSQDYDNALAKYIKLLDAPEFSSHKQIVLDIPRIFLMKTDTVEAVKYVNKGMEIYPEDNEVATQYIEYNLMVGNEKEVIGSIENLVSKDPNNKQLYYYLGIAYGSSENMDKAEEAYRKALSIDPDYVDANINLGGLILNKGIDNWNIVNNQRDITQQQYDAEIEKTFAIFDSAYPYLQKAVDLNDTNLIALANLQKYYQIKDNQEKAAELQAKIDALGGY